MHQETNYCASDLLNTSRVIDKVGIYSKYTEVLPIEDIINGMLDWVRVIDRNNNIIYANKAMLDDIKHQVVGKNAMKFL